MIYFDTTEARKTSPIANDLDSIGTPIFGLEAMTKADILITPLDTPVLPSTLSLDVIPHELALKKLCQAGWLIQRKSGRDTVSSIPEYTRILTSMIQWSKRNWLLTTGTHTRNAASNIVVNGLETGFLWVAFQGALRSWQLDGGYWAHLNSDQDVGNWLIAVDTSLSDWHGKPHNPKVILPKRHVRDILGAEDKDAQVMTLTTLPGIGVKLAWRCWHHWGHNLAICLMWLSNYALYQEGPDLYPKGIGPTIIQDCEQWFGGNLFSEPLKSLT